MELTLFETALCKFFLNVLECNTEHYILVHSMIIIKNNPFHYIVYFGKIYFFNPEIQDHVKLLSELITIT